MCAVPLCWIAIAQAQILDDAACSAADQCNALQALCDARGHQSACKDSRIDSLYPFQTVDHAVAGCTTRMQALPRCMVRHKAVHLQRQTASHLFKSSFQALSPATIPVDDASRLPAWSLAMPHSYLTHNEDKNMINQCKNVLLDGTFATRHPYTSSHVGGVGG